MSPAPDVRAEAEVPFVWNGRVMRGREGDTIAAALWRNGVRRLGVSRKHHRPMGASGAYLQGVLVQADGEPHVRADQRRITPGLDVRRQNAWPHTRLDLLDLLQAVPSGWTRGGFEQTMLFPGGTRRFEAWERLLAELAGEVAIDVGPGPEAPAGERIDCDVVVAGAGPAGIEAANAAAAAGESVVLVGRGSVPAETASAFAPPPEPLRDGVLLLLEHEAAATYRQGRVVVAAPVDGRGPAVLVVARRLVLATGRRSCPPLVPGHDLPGVLDPPSAIRLARRLGAALGPVVVVGSGGRREAAEALGRLGVAVALTSPLAELRRIVGRGEVEGVELEGRGRIACRTVVHAGPWRREDSLGFQAGAAGALQLTGGELPAGVTRVGGAAEQDEAIVVGDLDALRGVSLCPCMDVTVGEALDVARQDSPDPEIVKRRTSCGMGPCQGFPCWEFLGAVLASVDAEAAARRPTRRAPRRGLTVAQAAGLDGLLELDR